MSFEFHWNNLDIFARDHVHGLVQSLIGDFIQSFNQNPRSFGDDSEIDAAEVPAQREILDHYLEMNGRDFMESSEGLDIEDTHQEAHNDRPLSIGYLSIKELDLGDSPPNIEIISIEDVDSLFLEDITESSNSNFSAGSHVGPILAQDGYSSDGFSSNRQTFSNFGASSIRRASLYHWSESQFNPSFYGIPELENPLPSSSHHGPWEDPDILEQEVPKFDLASKLEVQFVLNLQYSGNARVIIDTDARLNYPSPSFLVMPMKLALSEFRFAEDMKIIVSYLKGFIYISLKVEDDAQTNSASNPNAHFSSVSSINEHVSPTNFGNTFIHKIFNMRINSEIGDPSKKHVLKNGGGKLEKFILDRLNVWLQDNLVYPRYRKFWVG